MHFWNLEVIKWLMAFGNGSSYGGDWRMAQAFTWRLIWSLVTNGILLFYYPTVMDIAWGFYCKTVYRYHFKCLGLLLNTFKEQHHLK